MGKKKNLNKLYSDQELKDLYYEGNSLVKIARLCECSDFKMRAYFKEIGLKFRGKRKRICEELRDTRIWNDDTLNFEEEIKTKLY